MITCRELIDFLGRHLDGELAAEEEAEFQQHLADCPPCLTYIETYRQTIRLGKAAHATPKSLLAAPVPEDLVKAIMAARRKAP